jgi:CRISPR-associated protein Cas2
MNEERLYIVAYDIADEKRWRRVFRTVQGYGEWLQLSLFQCRLTKRRRQELEARLREVIHNSEDHVLLVDIGPADGVDLALASLGKNFVKVEREATII